jgi:hypothetical protein
MRPPQGRSGWGLFVAAQNAIFPRTTMRRTAIAFVRMACLSLKPHAADGRSCVPRTHFSTGAGRTDTFVPSWTRPVAIDV